MSGQQHSGGSYYATCCIFLIMIILVAAMAALLGIWRRNNRKVTTTHSQHRGAMRLRLYSRYFFHFGWGSRIFDVLARLVLLGVQQTSDATFCPDGLAKPRTNYGNQRRCDVLVSSTKQTPP